LAFLRLIDLHVPQELEVHLVLDNLSAHKHQKSPSGWRIRNGMAQTGGTVVLELTTRRLRRDSFRSLDKLIDAIELWAEHWNDNPKPFVWHKTAEEIIAKVRRESRPAVVVKSETHH